MIGNFGSIDNPLLLQIEKSIANKVRTELRYASDRKLRSIVQAFDKLPFYIRYALLPCNEEYWFEKSLRYNTARALLLGKLNWEKLERQEREEIERKQKEKEDDKKRQELLRKIDGIEFFSGSLEEFQAYKGHEYEIVRGQFRFESRIDQNMEKFLELAEQGVEALIRYNYGDTWGKRSGIPVRRKSSS